MSLTLACSLTILSGQRPLQLLPIRRSTSLTVTCSAGGAYGRDWPKRSRSKPFRSTVR